MNTYFDRRGQQENITCFSYLSYGYKNKMPIQRTWRSSSHSSLYTCTRILDGLTHAKWKICQSGLPIIMHVLIAHVTLTLRPSHTVRWMIWKIFFDPFHSYSKRRNITHGSWTTEALFDCVHCITTSRFSAKWDQATDTVESDGQNKSNSNDISCVHVIRTTLNVFVFCQLYWVSTEQLSIWRCYTACVSIIIIHIRIISAHIHADYAKRHRYIHTLLRTMLHITFSRN